jgi:hypothetical protein
VGVSSRTSPFGSLKKEIHRLSLSPQRTKFRGKL